jgi:glycosyltransferase involved in cell wall biosynthesis
MEYSKLAVLLNKYPEAIYHVGDWPLSYWRSLRSHNPIISILGEIRARLRLMEIKKSPVFVFVSVEDTNKAISYGYRFSTHIPIGVNKPSIGIANSINTRMICFSGNMRYGPNKEAAYNLLELASNILASYKIVIVGYYATDIEIGNLDNVYLIEDVYSVVNYLAENRPVFISLLKTGAGSKNKILEALSAGCPIICTSESLDVSIPKSSAIQVISTTKDIIPILKYWNSDAGSIELKQCTDSLSAYISTERSWSKVATMLDNERRTNR